MQRFLKSPYGMGRHGKSRFRFLVTRSRWQFQAKLPNRNHDPVCVPSFPGESRRWFLASHDD
jgi:hypothetical protein